MARLSKKHFTPARQTLPVLLLGVLIFSAWLSACGGSSSGSGGTAAPVTGASSGQTGPGSAAVSIRNYAFSPNQLTVTRGTTVIWTNNDPVGHTVTSDDGKFNSGIIASAKTFSYTFNASGTYAYYCTIHPYMKAEVIVK